LRVSPLAETRLVSERHDLSQSIALEMIALFDHPANRREAMKASPFRPSQGKRFEVRNDPIEQLPGRPTLVLESAVTAGLSDRAASEVDLQILEERSVPLVQRKRERRAHLDARPELGAKREGDAEASFSLRQARDEPRI
jgi:hypothetical protein